MVDDSKKRRLTRRKSGGGGRGTATPSKETEAEAQGDAISRAGSKKKFATFCKSPTQLMGVIIKQCLKRGHCAEPSSTRSSWQRSTTW